MIKRFVLPLVCAILIIIACIIYLNYDSPPINSGTDNILYNDIVYERTSPKYNLEISDKNAEYIGDFKEILEYGQEALLPVHKLNSDANILYSHVIWLKPGYSLPSEYGEEFMSVEYVASEGTDFSIIADEYNEKATLLDTFEGSVKLEDIIESQASELAPTEDNIYGGIRFFYKNHADLRLIFAIGSIDGEYYLDVRHSTEGTHNWFKIKPEYVDLLTSAIFKKQ